MDLNKPTFSSPDWQLVKKECEDGLVKYRSLLESPTTTYKEKLIAIGQIATIKKILNLPYNFVPQTKG